MGEFLKKSFQEALETLCDALERRLENGQQRVLDAMCRRTAGLMVKAQVDELAKLMATLIRIHGAMQTRTDTSIALRQLQAAVGSAMQAIAPAVAQPASAQPRSRRLLLLWIATFDSGEESVKGTICLLVEMPKADSIRNRQSKFSFGWQLPGRMGRGRRL